MNLCPLAKHGGASGNSGGTTRSAQGSASESGRLGDGLTRVGAVAPPCLLSTNMCRSTAFRFFIGTGSWLPHFRSEYRHMVKWRFIAALAEAFTCIYHKH